MAQGGATPAGFPTLRGGLGLLAIQALTEHPMRVCEVYDEGDFAELGIGTEPLEHPDD